MSSVMMPAVAVALILQLFQGPHTVTSQRIALLYVCAILFIQSSRSCTSSDHFDKHKAWHQEKLLHGTMDYEGNWWCKKQGNKVLSEGKM